MASPENRFKKQAMGAFKNIPHSWFFIKEAGSIRGIPDAIGIVSGRFVALELKKSLTDARKKTGRIRGYTFKASNNGTT